MATTQKAIRSAEEAHEAYMDRFLDNLTDDDDTVLLHYALRENYEKKHNFLVMEFKENTWIIAAATPVFYPDCPIVGYLQQECFTSAIIDDEYNLIVSVPNPCNSMDDADYIAKSFDEALEWLPKWQKWKAAQKQFIQARKAMQQAQKELAVIYIRA